MYFSTDIKLKHHASLQTQYQEKYDSKFRSPNVHLGQRKLLLSEIQFLNEYYKKNTEDPTLLYVGAAPGTHLLLLHVLFPKVKFVLYDGAKFDIKLKKFPSIFEIHEGETGFFTSDLCRKLKMGDNLLLVSDIRLGEADFQAGVARDMFMQKEWVEILKPKMSLLKFRMPYSMKHGEKMSYFKGKILYGIFAKPTSGETRLLVHQKDISKDVLYDFKQYEESMFFHNKYERPYCFEEASNFKKYISEKALYCPCYDCIAELKVIREYMTIYKKTGTTLANMDETVNHLMKLPAKDIWRNKPAPLQNINERLTVTANLK
jgi:hypothetical protein